MLSAREVKRFSCKEQATTKLPWKAPQPIKLLYKLQHKLSSSCKQLFPIKQHFPFSEVSKENKTTQTDSPEESQGLLKADFRWKENNIMSSAPWPWGAAACKNDCSTSLICGWPHIACFLVFMVAFHCCAVALSSPSLGTAERFPQLCCSCLGHTWWCK